MNHILMSWNPGPANGATWDPIKFEDFLVVPFLAGKITRTRWSAGRNRNNIGPGDRRSSTVKGRGAAELLRAASSAPVRKLANNGRIRARRQPRRDGTTGGEPELAPHHDQFVAGAPSGAEFEHVCST